MKKKILAHIAILLILTGGFCNVYIKGLSISSCGNQLSVFAADDTYSWESVSKDDLVTAFKYYCKSRNLAIEGSVADAVTSFTTTTFNNICNTLGIDSTALQAELKKTAGGNLGLRFLFTQTGVNAYNRIFAEFLQNNDLSVGDTVEDKVLFSGNLFTDDNGNSCFIYELSSSVSPQNIQSYSKSKIIKYGTPLVYTSNYFNNNLSNGQIFNASFTFNGDVYSGNKTTTVGNSNGLGFAKYTYEGVTYVSTYDRYYAMSVSNNSNVYGHCCVYKVGNNYYIGSCRFNWSYYRYDADACNFYGVKITKNVPDNPADVTINTPTNTTINNNTYNNNYTIIYNDGDYYDYDDDDEPDPSTPPGGGGGGGGDDPDQPPIVDPTPTPEPTVPDWDIELPEMPVGNEWLLYGLEKKFPWDIPFNLMYMLSLFAADPETPHFQGTLDLKIVQWDYDIDLAPFDDIARNVRNFEFVGFIIGLMLLTRKLIWG